MKSFNKKQAGLFSVLALTLALASCGGGSSGGGGGGDNPPPSNVTAVLNVDQLSPIPVINHKPHNFYIDVTNNSCKN